MNADSVPNPVFDPTNADFPASVEQNGTKWNETTPLALREVQIRSIELILQGLSDTEIAKKLKIGRNTLWRWKTQDDDFRNCLAASRQQLHAAAVDSYQNTLLRATGVLGEFLDDKIKRHRLRAAQIVLNMAGCFRPPRLETNYSPNDSEPLMSPKQG